MVSTTKYCYSKSKKGVDSVKLDFLGVAIFGGILLIGLTMIICFIGVGILIMKALIKYIKSGDVRKEKSIIRKSLGEVLKQHRTDRNMTQEFVAEAIGVSRQAVSKWENGTSDPSTSNLIALARLFKISAEELLHEVH